jgi:hypothetical protein
VAEARYHLAQVNIARILAPLTDPVMADFVANLEPVNAIADGRAGFVWRLQTDEGDATGLRPYDDDRIIINLSVWADLASLSDFVYGGAHADVLKRRREWFERLTDVYIALWWVPAGHHPSVAEAVARLEYLKLHGPSPEAFTFREFYPAPDVSMSRMTVPAGPLR